MTRRLALALLALALAACADRGASATVRAFLDERLRGRQVVAEGYASADLRRGGYALVPQGPVRLARYELQRVETRGDDGTARVRWIEAFDGQEVSAFVETLALRRAGTQWLITAIAAGDREPLVPPDLAVVLVRAAVERAAGGLAVAPRVAVANRSPLELRDVEVSIVLLRHFPGGITDLVRRSTARLERLEPRSTATAPVRPIAVVPGDYELVAQVAAARGEIATDDNRASVRFRAP